MVVEWYHLLSDALHCKLIRQRNVYLWDNQRLMAVGLVDFFYLELASFPREKTSISCLNMLCKVDFQGLGIEQGKLNRGLTFESRPTLNLLFSVLGYSQTFLVSHILKAQHFFS